MADQKPRMPTVSVVVPTCGRPQLLLRAVHSVLNQTFSNLEVVVVIDGVDPETITTLEAVRDARLRFIEVGKKVGGAEARNIGVRGAFGDWIALLDDDDEWLPGKLQSQIELAESRVDDPVLVTSAYLCRAENAADTVRPRRLPKAQEPLAEFMFDFLCYFQTSTFLCPRRLFLEVPFDPDAKFFQDIDWMLRLSKVPGFELLITEKPLTVYHIPSARPGITSGLDWRSRLEWGTRRRHLMSRRAYSRFIVGSCVGRAVQDGAGFAGFRALFYETVVHGSPSPSLVFLLCLGFLVTPSQRKRLRDLFFLARPSTPRGV